MHHAVIERNGQAAPIALQNATQTRRDRCHVHLLASCYDPSSGRLTPSSNHAILQPISKKGISYALEQRHNLLELIAWGNAARRT